MRTDIHIHTMRDSGAAGSRKYHIASYGGRYTVYEVVRGGERAVSKEFRSKEEAEAALKKLQENK